MKKSFLPTLVAALLVFLSPGASPSCSLSLGPNLWELARRADAIVLARVDAIEATSNSSLERDEDADHFEEDTVAVGVLETWKGPAMADVRIQISDAAHAPYKVGDVILVFLDRGDSLNLNWEPSAEEWASFPPEVRDAIAESLPQGRRQAAWAAGRWFDIGGIPADATFPPEKDRAALRDLVTSAVRLQSRGKPDLRAFRDWLVSAAELRITRYEGLSQLRWDLVTETVSPPESNGDVVVVDDTDAEPEDTPESAPEPLTREQLARLAAAFAREPSVDASDVTMLELLADDSDLDVDRTAASVVEAGLLLKPIPAWVTAMVEVTLRRYGDNFADRIGRDDRDKDGNPIYTGWGENTLPTIWEVARRELGIPSVAPAETPARPTVDRNEARE